MSSSKFPYSQNQKKTFDSIGKLFVKEFRDELDKDGANSSHDLEKSFKFKIEPTNTGYTLKLSSLSYFDNIDKGRKQGVKLVPIDALTQWIYYKDLYDSSKFKTIESMSWAIAVSIQKKGIQPKDIKKKVSDKLKNKVKRQISVAYKKDIQEYIRKEYLKL